MVKLFMTGDNHFGKKYDRYSDVKDILTQSRFDVLDDMVKKAEKEGCELFVVTGDLFDNVNNIKVSDVKRVAEILASFVGTVILIPGNHDYYTGDEKVWKDFEKALSKVEHNIILIKEFRTYEIDTVDDKVVVYPAFCQSKHAKKNNLEWIKNKRIQEEGVINLGIAHGAIKGVTPDMKEEYFLMTEKELTDIPIDAWLIGHTHIPYPDILKEDESIVGYKIFNAGTHEQTDLHNNTEGNGFIITIEKNGENATVSARKYVSGKVRYYDLEVNVKPDSESALSNVIKAELDGKRKNSVVRINVKGSVKKREYEDRENIYRQLLKEYLTYEIVDNELSEEITVDKIREEYAETSFAAQFMENLMDNTTELQMAYQLLEDCKED